jgi:flagellar motor switch protein FliM
MPNEPILNQEEVDALLSGMNEGRLGLDGDDLPAGEVRRYELGREVRILRGRMPTFDLINEHHFASAASGHGEGQTVSYAQVFGIHCRA